MAGVETLAQSIDCIGRNAKITLHSNDMKVTNKPTSMWIPASIYLQAAVAAVENKYSLSIHGTCMVRTASNVQVSNIASCCEMISSTSECNCMYVSAFFPLAASRTTYLAIMASSFNNSSAWPTRSTFKASAVARFPAKHVNTSEPAHPTRRHVLNVQGGGIALQTRTCGQCTQSRGVTKPCACLGA